MTKGVSKTVTPFPLVSCLRKQEVCRDDPTFQHWRVPFLGPDCLILTISLKRLGYRE
nr:MAG TPA: hypothetical protein [Bacteriophage sp.]